MARFEIEARSRRVVINDVDFTDCVYDDSIELVNVSPKGLPLVGSEGETGDAA